MRLNQFLARAGVSSRRGGDDLIRRGAVTVNGGIVQDMGRQVDPEKDAVKVNGKRIFVEVFHYFVFNKPEGLMCTLEDPEGRPCLGDMISRLGAGRLFPVGRLDYKTEGILLLTNDGDLAQKLLHPKFQVARTYLAKVQGILTTAEFEKMAQGVHLEDGWAKAEVKPVEKMEKNSYVRVTVREGRNRLVRRLFVAVGHPVVKLQRVGFGPMTLGNLAPGEAHRLGTEEIKALKAFAAGVHPQNPSSKGNWPSWPRTPKNTSRREASAQGARSSWPGTPKNAPRREASAQGPRHSRGPKHPQTQRDRKEPSAFGVRHTQKRP